MDYKAAVKDKYGELIKGKFSCCEACCASCGDIPSFGVGAPVEFAELKPGEKVLDIGSGAGGNCLKAASIVGEQGKITGLDMTEEMVSEAKGYAEASGLKNLEFIRGDADDMPFSAESFDVVISDCVINLIPDKGKVFREMFRVLKPGGRVAIADVSSDREFPDELKEDENLWCGCVSGAVPDEVYLRMFREAGFSRAEIPAKDYSKDVSGIKLYNAVFRGFK